MNKLIAITISLLCSLSSAFAVETTYGPSQASNSTAMSSSQASAMSENKSMTSTEIKMPIDPDVMSYMESRRGTEVTKMLRHGQQLFLIEAPETMPTDQIFKCFKALNLEDTKRGAALIKTSAAEQRGRIEFFGVRSVLVTDSKPEEFRCD